MKLRKSRGGKGGVSDIPNFIDYYSVINEGWVLIDQVRSGRIVLLCLVK